MMPENEESLKPAIPGINGHSLAVPLRPRKKQVADERIGFSSQNQKIAEIIVEEKRGATATDLWFMGMVPLLVFIIINGLLLGKRFQEFLQEFPEFYFLILFFGGFFIVFMAKQAHKKYFGEREVRVYKAVQKRVKGIQELKERLEDKDIDKIIDSAMSTSYWKEESG